MTKCKLNLLLGNQLPRRGSAVDREHSNIVVDENAKYHVSTHPSRSRELDTNAGKTGKPSLPLGSINWYYPKRSVLKTSGRGLG